MKWYFVVALVIILAQFTVASELQRKDGDVYIQISVDPYMHIIRQDGFEQNLGFTWKKTTDKKWEIEVCHLDYEKNKNKTLKSSTTLDKFPVKTKKLGVNSTSGMVNLTIDLKSKECQKVKIDVQQGDVIQFGEESVEITYDGTQVIFAVSPEEHVCNYRQCHSEITVRNAGAVPFMMQSGDISVGIAGQYKVTSARPYYEEVPVYDCEGREIDACVQVGVQNMTQYRMADVAEDWQITIIPGGEKVFYLDSVHDADNMVYKYNVSILLNGVAYDIDPYFTTTNTTFSLGAYNHTYLNVSGYVRLNLSYASGEYTSKIFDAGSDVHWHHLYWNSTVYGTRLPGNRQAEATTYGMNMVGNRLLLHMDETSGVVRDSSGASNDGTQYKTLTYSQPGVFNTSIYCDTTSHINISNESQFDYLTAKDANYTISFWIKTSDTVATIFGKGITSTPVTRFSIVSPGYLRITHQSGGNYVVKETVNKVADNRWRHVVMKGNNGNYEIWINGTNQTLTTYSSGAYTQSNNNYRLSICAYPSPTGMAETLYGYLDEIAFFNRSLSSAEIYNLYRRGTATMNMSVRSCDDAACSGESWVNIGSQPSGVLPVAENQYFQYKARIIKGVGSAQLWSVAIDYEPHNYVLAVAIRPSVAYANDTLSGNCTGISSNGENISYQYKWYKNDTLSKSGYYPNSTYMVEDPYADYTRVKNLSTTGAEMIFNYTKPVNAVGAVLEIKWNVNSVSSRFNVTVPTSCWTYKTNKLYFNYTQATTGNSYMYCRNSTGWQLMSSSTANLHTTFSDGTVITKWYDGDWGTCAVRNGIFYAISNGALFCEKSLHWEIIRSMNATNKNIDNYTGLLNKNENITLSCRIYNGTQYSNYVNTSILIQDSPPTKPASVTVSPSTAYSADKLTCAVSGGTDIDGDTITRNIRWYNGTAAVAALENSTTVAFSYTKAGETWKCAARNYAGGLYSDYTNATRAITAYPTAFSRVSPSIAFTDDTILGYCNATAATKAVAYAWRFYRNNTLYRAMNYTQANRTVQMAADSTSIIIVNSQSAQMLFNYTKPQGALNATLEVRWVNANLAVRFNAIIPEKCWAFNPDILMFNYTQHNSGIGYLSCRNLTGWQLINQSYSIPTYFGTIVTVARWYDGDWGTCAIRQYGTYYSFSNGAMFCEKAIHWAMPAGFGAVELNLNNVSSTLTAKGEAWKFGCAVRYAGENGAWVNSSALTISNSVPTFNQSNFTYSKSHKYNVSMQINASDIDGDTLSFAVNDTRFYINGSTGLLNKTNSIGTVGEYNITINVTDGSGASEMWIWFNITNAAPNVTSVTITPAGAQNNDNLTCNNVTTDADDDMMTKYETFWYRNDVLQSAHTNHSIVNSSYTSVLDAWNCSVRAYDGQLWSAFTTSTAMVVGDNISPSLTNDYLSAASGSNDAPFMIYVNVTETNAVSWVIVEVTNPNSIATNFTMSLEAGAANNGQYKKTYVPSTDGLYTFRFYARDSSGNVGILNSALTYQESTITVISGGGGGLATIAKKECDIRFSVSRIIIRGAAVTTLEIYNNDTFVYDPVVGLSTEIAFLRYTIPTERILSGGYGEINFYNEMLEKEAHGLLTLSSTNCADVAFNVDVNPSILESAFLTAEIFNIGGFSVTNTVLIILSGMLGLSLSFVKKDLKMGTRLGVSIFTVLVVLLLFNIIF